MHRPNIMGPSIIKNKSYVVDQPEGRKHRHRPSDVGTKPEPN